MKYFIKKSITLIITLFVVTIFTFIAFEIIPGDSVLSSLGLDATTEDYEALKESMGMNDPLPVRYGRWFQDAISGDFGDSTQYKVPVTELIGGRFPVTIGLALVSITLILLFAIPIGLLSAKVKNARRSGVFLFFTQLGMAIPSFFLGIIITLVFGIILKWFTPGKYVSISESFGGYLYCLLFPAIAVAVPKIAMLAKFLRTSILNQLELDYVRTAKSKGHTMNGVLFKHVLKNALIPVITFMAMIFAEVLAGSIIVEQVFNLPGLGRLLVVSIASRDFPVVQVIVMYIAAVVLIMNFVVDLLYQYIDPRVQME